MDSLVSFSTEEWIRDTFPCDDSDSKVDDLKKKINEAFDKSVHQDRKEIVDMIDIIHEKCKNMSDDSAVEDLIMLCDYLDRKIKSLIDRVRSNSISLGNGYFLCLSALPVAVRFLKFLHINRYIYIKSNRKHFEDKYKEFQLQCGETQKFSNVLFALSWMNILIVYNNNYILMNWRNEKFFE
jgi:hypothetical protein